MPDTSKLEKLNRELEKSEKKLRKAINDEKALDYYTLVGAFITGTLVIESVLAKIQQK